MYQPASPLPLIRIPIATQQGLLGPFVTGGGCLREMLLMAPEELWPSCFHDDLCLLAACGAGFTFPGKILLDARMRVRDACPTDLTLV